MTGDVANATITARRQTAHRLSLAMFGTRGDRTYGMSCSLPILHMLVKPPLSSRDSICAPLAAHSLALALGSGLAPRGEYDEDMLCGVCD